MQKEHNFKKEDAAKENEYKKRHANEFSRKHMSGQSLSNEEFYSEVYADRNVKPVENLKDGYSRGKANTEISYKGRKQR